MGAQRGPYGLNNDSQPVEHISKATPTGQKKATKTIRTNIQEGQGAMALIPLLLPQREIALFQFSSFCRTEVRDFDA